jgi:hypothetical protein
MKRPARALGELPIRIQHRCGVPSKQRELFRQSTLLADRYNSKGTSATGFPIHRKILRVDLESPSGLRPTSVHVFNPHLHQVRVPSIATDMQIIVARFLSRWLPKDMSCGIPLSA